MVVLQLSIFLDFSKFKCTIWFSKLDHWAGRNHRDHSVPPFHLGDSWEFGTIPSITELNLVWELLRNFFNQEKIACLTANWDCPINHYSFIHSFIFNLKPISFFSVTVERSSSSIHSLLIDCLATKLFLCVCFLRIRLTRNLSYQCLLAKEREYNCTFS